MLFNVDFVVIASVVLFVVVVVHIVEGFHALTFESS